MGLIFVELVKMLYNDFIYKYLDFINLKYDLKKYFLDIDFKDIIYENIFEIVVYWNELLNLNGLIYVIE